MGNSLCTVNIGDEESGWLFTVLEYCDVGIRSNAIFLSKRYMRILTTESSFRWRLERLHLEDGIYFPGCCAAIRDDSEGKANYQALYLQLYPQRSLWRIDQTFSNFERLNSDDDNRENSRIKVFVRCKPLASRIPDSDLSSQPSTLPLHQRLALIRLIYGLRSNKDALKVLKNQGHWFRKKWLRDDDRIQMSNSIDNEKCLSFNENPREGPSTCNQSLCGIQSIDTCENIITVIDKSKGIRKFTFDCVFPIDYKQAQVYRMMSQAAVTDFINGKNATCLAYGMTGSGKTFTMFGPSDEKAATLSGIIPRACKEVFEAISYRAAKVNLNIVATVSLSYVEVYGNRIYDLLRKGTEISQSKVASHRYVLSGAAEVHLNDMMDVRNALAIGAQQKRKAHTAMNERSTRAHSVFILKLQQTCKNTNISRTSKLFLADLGGCEQMKKSKIESGCSKHQEQMKSSGDHGTVMTKDIKNASSFSVGFVKSDRMREAVQINLGLMALKSCVRALNCRDRGITHVPYANSKLTMLLSSGLGGNNSTCVIICIAQEIDHLVESIASLAFGQSCRNVSNTVLMNSDLLEHLLSDINGKIADCEAKIKSKERWETIEKKRVDILAEDGTLEHQGFGCVEVHKVTNLIGAEDERRELNQLLAKRASLTGIPIEGTFNGRHYGGGIGFGRSYVYGFGSKYIGSLDANEENARFRDDVNIDEVPMLVKNKGCFFGWRNPSQESNENEVNTDATITTDTYSRYQSAYAGLSA